MAGAFLRGAKWNHSLLFPRVRGGIEAAVVSTGSEQMNVAGH